jgi:hypothetical protein
MNVSPHRCKCDECRSMEAILQEFDLYPSRYEDDLSRAVVMLQGRGQSGLKPTRDT